MQEDFRSGRVRFGWRRDAILALAQLDDDCVVTRATADNQRLWELGDVFEIFLRDESREDYLELHVAPSGHRLQLHFPSARTIGEVRNGTRRTEDFLTAPAFQCLTRQVRDGWEVATLIPAASLGTTEAAGMSLRVSFCRYDASSDGKPPMLSSTSPHALRDFHRQQEWTRVLLA